MELTVNRSNISSTVVATVNRIGDIYEYLDNLPLWMGSEFRSRMRAVQLALEAVPTLHMTRFQSEIFERTKQLLRISADGEDFLKAGCADLHTDRGTLRLDWSVADLCEEQIGEWKSTFRTVMLGWRYDVLCPRLATNSSISTYRNPLTSTTASWYIQQWSAQIKDPDFPIALAIETCISYTALLDDKSFASGRKDEIKLMCKNVHDHFLQKYPSYIPFALGGDVQHEIYGSLHIQAVITSLNDLARFYNVSSGT